jgi:hypothetical protein
VEPSMFWGGGCAQETTPEVVPMLGKSRRPRLKISPRLPTVEPFVFWGGCAQETTPEVVPMFGKSRQLRFRFANGYRDGDLFIVIKLLQDIG